MTNTTNTTPTSGAADLLAMVSKALRDAYNLGQRYRQQADSEYISRHRKADATRAKFLALVEETCATLAAGQATAAQATPAYKDSTPELHIGDHRNSRAWPKVSGVSRDEGHSRALLVFFAAEPTDDEVRAVHDTLAAAPTTKPAPQPLPASHGNVTEVLDIPDQCPYSGPSSHRDVWLAGWYAARKQGGA